MEKTAKPVEQYLSEIKAINDEKEKVDSSIGRLEKAGNVFLITLDKDTFEVPHVVGEDVVKCLKNYFYRRREILIEKATQLIRQQQ